VGSSPPVLFSRCRGSEGGRAVPPQPSLTFLPLCIFPNFQLSAIYPPAGRPGSRNWGMAQFPFCAEVLVSGDKILGFLGGGRLLVQSFFCKKANHCYLLDQNEARLLRGHCVHLGGLGSAIPVIGYSSGWTRIGYSSDRLFHWVD